MPLTQTKHHLELIQVQSQTNFLIVHRKEAPVTFHLFPPPLISPSCTQIPYQKANLGQNIQLSIFKIELFFLKLSISSSAHKFPLDAPTCWTQSLVCLESQISAPECQEQPTWWSASESAALKWNLKKKSSCWRRIKHIDTVVIGQQSKIY